MVATQASDGMKLYVDGALVASGAVTGSQSYNGFWRVGGDNLASWPGQPTSSYFAGSIDEAAVYTSELSAAQVADQFAKGNGAANVAPTASFTSSANNSDRQLRRHGFQRHRRHHRVVRMELR